MGTTYLDRRQLLKGLGVGALAAGAVATLPATVLAEDDHAGPAGAWTINIHEGGSTRQATVTLGPGGIVTTVDSLTPGAVGAGLWKGRDGGKFVFKFTVYDFSQVPAGAPGVTVVVSGNGTAKGNAMSGTFSVTVFGSVVATGTFDGTRMTV